MSEIPIELLWFAIHDQMARKQFQIKTFDYGHTSS